jgi:hypothetical protein
MAKLELFKEADIVVGKGSWVTVGDPYLVRL